MFSGASDTPEGALKMNCLGISRAAAKYGTAAKMQLANCRHRNGEEFCADCLRASQNLLFFAAVCGIAAGAAGEGKQAELYDLLTKFAAENLDGFPKDLSKKGLYHSETDFPEVIGD